VPGPPDPAAPGLPLTVEAKLRAAFDLSPTVLTITADGRFVDVNDAFLRLHGYAREEVIGRAVSDLNLWVDPDQRQRALAILGAGAPVRTMEVRLRTKAGAERVCVLNADIIVIDERTCILTALTDITDRVQAEEALRESEQRFILAFHANPLPMSITRLPDGIHLEVNDAAVRHSGFTRDEMLGRTKAELGFWVSPEQRDTMVQRLRDDGVVRDFQVDFQTRSGARRQLLVNSQAMTFGGVPAVLSVSVDITDRLELEAESRARRVEAETLAESLRQADRVKNEFLAMLGHELRNPLATIGSAMAVLDNSVRADADRQVIAVVNRQVVQLARLVDDLLDMSRLMSGKIALRLQPVDVHALAQRCIDALVRSGRGVGHQIVLEGEAVHAAADATRLEQIIGNLLDNALKYTPRGGRIIVRTMDAGHDAVVSVEDTGKGIDPNLLPRVFDPFVQEPQGLDRAAGGLGLGLAVVRRLVDLHGGSVSADSAGPGRGTTFTVRLKGARRAAERTETATPARAPVSPRRVLIVEDHADAREMLKILLQSSGHIVETSEDGLDGLAKLESFRPDVALIDVGLPGIDGYTLARRARHRAETRGVRLVALTGYGQAEDRAKALAAGFDRHVTKPVDPVVLEELVGSL
jgi:two-component system, sensor histidine kinase